MTTTYTVGSSSRNYSTVQAAWNALPSTLVDNYVLSCYNDSEFTGSAGAFDTSVSAKTMAGFTVTVNCASGQSFHDNAGKLTNALTYNVSNGVGFNHSGGTGFAINVDGIILEGLQITSASLPIYQSVSGPNVLVKNCIAVCASATTSEGAISLYDGTAVNSLGINSSGGGCGFLSNADSHVAHFYFCTAIQTGASGGYGFRANYNAAIVINCASFGFATPYHASSPGFDSSCDYNASDAASPPGSHSVGSLTFASQFVSTTTDFRPKSGNGLVFGTRDATHTSDLDILLQARSTSTPTVGAMEYIAAAPAPTLSSPTGSSTGSTTATGGCTTDTGSGTLYRYISTNSTESSATIEASGTSVTVTATGAQSVTFTGLTASTTYYAHFVQVGGGGTSNVVNSTSFTTSAPSGKLFRSGLGGGLSGLGSSGPFFQNPLQ